MNILFDFIMTERFQYADINVFAENLGPALRYYEFLLFIIDRYEEANKGLAAVHEEERTLMPAKAGISRVTPEQGLLMVKSSELTTQLHLEIESFYLFAKILLDNVTRFLYVYFGLERGVGLKSHDALAKEHKKYFKAKGLVVPEGLSESIDLLKKNICDYRDKKISHELSIRTQKATAWSGSGGARIVVGETRKDDNTAVVWRFAFTFASTSAELPQLMDKINAYIGQVKTLIELNRVKARFQLKS